LNLLGTAGIQACSICPEGQFSSRERAADLMRSSTVVSMEGASSSISAWEIRDIGYDPQDENYLFVLDRYNDKLVRSDVFFSVSLN